MMRRKVDEREKPFEKIEVCRKFEKSNVSDQWNC